ncbi:hypothetical protein [Nocardioides psychrotolerans]|uniref:hypothetical protein n=1 Tax=Nocardioides psychrotolerans TaxID=1005945 RepID=UPI0031380A80
MTQPQGMGPACARCGAPAVTGRFCTNCGAAVGATADTGSSPGVLPGPPAPAAPRGPSGFTRAMRAVAHFRTPLVLLPLIGALVVSGGIGARMLWEQVPGPEPEAATVRCWDGELSTQPQDCGLPEGVAGLRWVFPSFQPDEDDCRDVLLDNPAFTRPTMWECTVEVGGAPVVITYSELTGVKPARAFIQREYGDAERLTVEADNGTPVRFEWRRELDEEDGSAGFVVTSMYVDLPYAVEVRAEDRVLREDALATAVRFRGVTAISYR